MECGNQGSRRKKIRKNSPSIVSVAGGAQEDCPATGTQGKLKPLQTQVHSLARADRITLPGVPDIRLHALPYNSATWSLGRDHLCRWAPPSVLSFPSQHKIIINPMQLTESGRLAILNEHMQSQSVLNIGAKYIGLNGSYRSVSKFSSPLHFLSLYNLHPSGNSTFPTNIPENPTSPRRKSSSI